MRPAVALVKVVHPAEGLEILKEKYGVSVSFLVPYQVRIKKYILSSLGSRSSLRNQSIEGLVSINMLAGCMR